MKAGYVAVAPVREAFERSGLTPYELAVRLDWREGPNKIDSQRVRRRLGLTTYHRGTRTRYGLRRCHHPLVAKEMREWTALAILDALQVAPIEVGL